MSVDETAADTFAPATSSPATDLVGTQLGAYRIEKLLGEGAMGAVFLATHVALGRHVAIKTLKPHVAADRLLTERFFAEARAVNIIRHENIVECTDLVNDPTGKSYIVMELLEGKTLGDAIREAGKLPPRRAVRIAAQIADAIGAAHHKGIIHRDLKPENVFLIRRAGSADYVKVLDFGIARLRPDLGNVAATQSGALIGTPAYMSPELVRGEKAGPAADIYALATMTFLMLTGRLPFDAVSVSMMLVAQLQETPRRVDDLASDIPRPLADLIARGLAKEPAERPASMDVFRTALLAAAGLPAESRDSHTAIEKQRDDAVPAADLEIAATQIPTTPHEATGERRRHVHLWIGGAVLLAVIGAGIVAAALGRGDDTTTVANTGSADPAILESASETIVAFQIEAQAPPFPDEAAKRRWQLVEKALTTKRFGHARELLAQWEATYGATKQTTTMREQLDALPPSLLANDLDDERGNHDHDHEDPGTPDADEPDDPVDIQSFELRSKPESSVYARDGKQLCSTPCTYPLERTAAPTAFVFERPGYRSQTVIIDPRGAKRAFEVTLEPLAGGRAVAGAGAGSGDDRPRPSARQAAVGKLSLTSNVEAKILIAGKPRGKTPLDVMLPAGKHRIAALAGRRHQLMIVDVRAGETIVKRFEFPPAGE